MNRLRSSGVMMFIISVLVSSNVDLSLPERARIGLDYTRGCLLCPHIFARKEGLIEAGCDTRPIDFFDEGLFVVCPCSLLIFV